MINTTFTNFNKDSVMNKIAFFNVFFKQKNSFILDTFFSIDFTTISTNEALSTKELVEPEVIILPDNSQPIKTFNIFSNKKFSEKNKIDYELIQDVKFDSDKGEIIGDIEKEKTPGPSPLPTETPTKSQEHFETETLVIDIPKSQENFELETNVHLIPIETIKSTETTNIDNLNNQNNNNNNSRNKKKINGEVIAGIVVGFIVFISIVAIIAIVLVQKKRNSLLQKSSDIIFFSFSEKESS